MADDQTLKVYDTQTEAYSNIVEWEEASASLTLFLKSLPANGKILDLGCGPGHHAKLMTERGFDVDATDASPEMVKVAKQIPGLKARIATFDDLEAVQAYDGIWASFSLLHAPRAEFPIYLEKIFTALVVGGYFHIGMKLGNGDERDNLGRFYTYYSETELKDHLTNAGFSLRSEETGEEVGLAGQLDPWITILTQK